MVIASRPVQYLIRPNCAIPTFSPARFFRMPGVPSGSDWRRTMKVFHGSDLQSFVRHRTLMHPGNSTGYLQFHLSESPPVVQCDWRDWQGHHGVYSCCDQCKSARTVPHSMNSRTGPGLRLRESISLRHPRPRASARGVSRPHQERNPRRLGDCDRRRRSRRMGHERR